MKRFRLLFLAVATTAIAAADRPLDPLLPNSDWPQVSAQNFTTQNAPLDFRWVSDANDAARASGEGMTLFGLPVYESVAGFGADGTFNSLRVSFYNRGDAGGLEKEAFFALRDRIAVAISDFTKVKPAMRGKDATNVVKADGVEWQTPAAKFELEYSFTREVKTRSIPFRAEFIRLEIAPAGKKQGLLEAAFAAEAAAHFAGGDHVKKEASGDVRLAGIPMVDQGDKGYCVVASAERVMRYFGKSVDEHELAQIANSSAAVGTSNKAMFEALKKVSARLHVKTRTLEPFDVKELLELVRDYNRLAKRGKRAGEIDLSGPVIDVQQIYSEMKPDILREARTKNKSDLTRFQREIAAHIDQGMPLLWSVMLGIVQEPKLKPMVAGHMRLIIGYNAKTDEILYSDSWGVGNELKRMGLSDAWTITTGVNTIEPI